PVHVGRASSRKRVPRRTSVRPPVGVGSTLSILGVHQKTSRDIWDPSKEEVARFLFVVRLSRDSFPGRAPSLAKVDLLRRISCKEQTPGASVPPCTAHSSVSPL